MASTSNKRDPQKGKFASSALSAAVDCVWLWARARPGSEPWKRAAKRRGYVDWSLKDIFALMRMRGTYAKPLGVAQTDFGDAVTSPAGSSEPWFDRSHTELREITIEFAEKWFGRVDLPEDYGGSPWVENLTPQFIHYANEVAHEDVEHGGYDVMLKDKGERKWIVAGILAQIFARCIYSQSLFGATEKEIGILEEQDSNFKSGDGAVLFLKRLLPGESLLELSCLHRLSRYMVFANALLLEYLRASIRCHTINLMLGTRIVTERFWPAVNKVAAQLAVVLLPLLNLLNYAEASIAAEPQLDKLRFQSFFQELHTLVAHAAYFHIAMRRSPRIFRHSFATPGEVSHDQNDVPTWSESYYASSKFVDAKEIVFPEQQSTAPQAASTDTALSQARSKRSKEQVSADQYYSLKGKRVKYAIWPLLQCSEAFYPQGQIIDRKQPGYGSPMEGYRMEQRTVEIGKKAVMYCQGPHDSRHPSLNGITLLAHVEQEKKKLRKKRRMRRFFARCLILLLLLVAGWFIMEASKDGTLDRLFSQAWLYFKNSLQPYLDHLSCSYFDSWSDPYLEIFSYMPNMPIS